MIGWWSSSKTGRILVERTRAMAKAFDCLEELKKTWIFAIPLEEGRAKNHHALPKPALFDLADT